MSLSPSDLSTLSRLLDEAIDLPAAESEAWLSGLAAEHASLVPHLRQMLAARSGATGFLADGPKLEAWDDSVAHADEQIGPYRLIRAIGRGGMGDVWLAERSDGTLKRRVALKLPRLAWGAGLADRMARERDIGALLEHPNIARLYDAGVDAKGRPYLALEYIDGASLDDYCKAKALSIPDRLRLFLQVARAVAYAHGRLVVHRDLKPSNVLVTPDGQAHLLDFGIAKLLDDASPGGNLTQEQGRVLTPDYASPEQIRGGAITVASDVYSLGVLLFEMLTSQRLHARQDPGERERALDTDSAPLASSRAGDKATGRHLRGELDAIVAKALRASPDRRYGTADALADDVWRYLSRERVLARPDTFAYRLSRVARRHRAALAATALVLAVALAGAFVSLIEARQATASAARERVVKQFVVDVFKVNSPGDASEPDLRQLPAEMLLQRGGRLIETRFAGQPELQAELYGVVGGIFDDMGATDLAIEYGKRHVASLASIDATSRDRGRAMLAVGRSLLAQGELADAAAYARRASLLLDDTDTESSVEAHLLLANALHEAGNLQEALRELEGGEARLGPADRPSLARADIKTLRAAVARRQNRFDEAVPLYLAAIADCQAIQGPQSLRAAEIRLKLAYGMASFGDEATAFEQRDMALRTLRALGSTGQIRAAVEELTLAMLMFTNEQVPFAETRATMQRDESVLASFGTRVPESVNAKALRNIAFIYLFWGEVRRGDELAQRAGRMRAGFDDSPNDRWSLAIVLAWAARLTGRHEEAITRFEEVLALRKLKGEAKLPFVAYDYVNIAETMSMAGRPDDARALLAQAPKVEEIRGSPLAASFYTSAGRLALARIDLDDGDAQEALAWKSPPPGWHDQGVTMNSRIILGEAQCASGSPEEGLETLRRGLAPATPWVADINPELARARSVEGRCALAAARPSEAQALAAQARHAFDVQPDVSPYFKAPLIRLEEELRSGRGDARRRNALKARATSSSPATAPPGTAAR